MFGRKNRPEYTVGQRVLVYTPENWKEDGTGGKIGEILEVSRHSLTIIWTPDPSGTRTTEFSPNTGRARRGSDAWFQVLKTIDDEN